MSPLTIQENNDGIETRPVGVIEEALRRIVEVGLWHTFQHQSRFYVFQHDWQDRQKITYPRKTILPRPPDRMCSRNQQWLLTRWPGVGGAIKPLKAWQAPEDFTCEVVAVFPEKFATLSETVPKDLSVPLAVSVSREPLACVGAEPPVPSRSESRTAALIPSANEHQPEPTRTAALTSGHREHRNHACCGIVCLHASQFDEFLRRSRHQPDPDRYVREFFRTWDARYTTGDRNREPIGLDGFDFWRARWKETHPEEAPKGPDIVAKAAERLARDAARYGKS